MPEVVSTVLFAASLQHLLVPKVWSTDFSDPVIEAAYVAETFLSSCWHFVAFCGVAVVILATAMAAFPESSTELLISIICWVACLYGRLWLHSKPDQLRARLLCGRAINGLSIAGWATVLVCLHLQPQLPGSIGATFIVALVWILVPIYQRLFAMHSVHRLVWVASNCAGFVALPSRSVLGQPAEALVSCGALLLGELCAFSLETQWRKAYLRSRANTQEAVLRMSEEVASYVFHELRNDTNASMGVFESIVDAVASGKASLDPELTSMVNEGRVHARHAALVISNMLNFAKLRAGQLELELQTFDLRLLVDDTIAMVRHLLHETPEVSLVVVAPPSMHVVGAAFEVQQILLNLLSNACKHTKNGHVKLTVEDVACANPLANGNTAAEASAAPVTTLRFSVADTGSGVSATRKSSLLEGFFMEWHGGPTGHMGDGLSGIRAGSGLGLPLCCSLLRLMGSSLEFHEPEQGSGAVFSFVTSLQSVPTESRGAPERDSAIGVGSVAACRLRSSAPSATPAAPLLSPHPPALVPLKPTASSGLTTFRLLVADDMGINRRLLKLKLGRVLASPEVVEVETGEAALETLLSCTVGFDLVILDELYGGEDLVRGLEVTRRVRANRVRSRAGDPVPIIGCTGNSKSQHDIEAIASGQVCVWGKPQPTVEEMHEQLSLLLHCGDC